MGHSASSALFEESTANKMNNTRTDAPNASVLRTSASGSSMTEPTKIPMKATIVESLRTEGEPPSEPPSVVKGCDDDDDDDFGRRRFEQMGLIPLHQLDWIKFKMVVDDQSPPDLVEDLQSSEIEKPILHDTVVKSVIEKFKERSDLGMQKYGTTLDRTDLTSEEWANHMQEELMDAILYLERLKREFKHLQNRIDDEST